MKVADALLQQDLSHIALTLHSKTRNDVEHALSKEKLELDDFMALISPAGANYLEAMASRATTLPAIALVTQCSYLCRYTSRTYVPMNAPIAGSP